MRLKLALLALALLGAALPAVSAGTIALPASVKLVECSRENHEATFRGRMGRIEGSQRMAMRFTLLEKRSTGFQAVEAPGLGRWRKSKPDVAGFGYRQTVRGLQEGAGYRMQVDYRWTDDAGEVLVRARRRSRICRQFEQLPNLTADLVGASDAAVPGVVRYAVRVANTGVARATGVPVRVMVDGSVVDTVTLDLLKPGASRRLLFRGPECGSWVSATADPHGVIVESAEEDNAEALSCAQLPRG